MNLTVQTYQPKVSYNQSFKSFAAKAADKAFTDNVVKKLATVTAGTALATMVTANIRNAKEQKPYYNPEDNFVNKKAIDSVATFISESKDSEGKQISAPDIMIIKKYASNKRTKNIAAAKINDFLDSASFSPEIVDKAGNNILHIIAKLPVDSARMLIQKSLNKGIKIDLPNNAGQTPLVSAIKEFNTSKDENARKNLLSNITFLLRNGANVATKDNCDKTVLHYACMSENASMSEWIYLITLILSKKPDISALDKAGLCPYNYINTQEKKEMFDKMCEYSWSVAQIHF